MIASVPTSSNNLSRTTMRRVKLRSWIVRILRLLVPASGVLLLAYLVAPIVLEMFLPRDAFDAIRISEDRLIVDGPRARGTLADGGTYEVQARTAATELTNQDLIFLTDLLGTFNISEDMITRATSDSGEYLMSTEVLTLTTVIDIISTKGDVGEIGSGVADTKAQTFHGDNGVKFRFANGTELDADTMFYDAEKQYWRFTNSTLVLNEEPET